MSIAHSFMRDFGVLRWLILSVVWSGSSATAAFERFPEGGRCSAMGGAMTAVPHDAWASLSNPALLATLEEQCGGISWTPGMFGLPELRRTSGVLTTAVGEGSVAAHLEDFGFDQYRETTVGVLYGCRLNPLFNVGVALRWCGVAIRDYGSDWTLSLDAGVVCTLADDLSLGFSACNINRATIGAAKESIPQSIRVGVVLLPMPEVTFCGELSKESRFPSVIAFGLEYRIAAQCAVRGGITTGEPQYSAGLGFRVSAIRLDYAVTSHAELGATHLISITVDPSML